MAMVWFTARQVFIPTFTSAFFLYLLLIASRFACVEVMSSAMSSSCSSSPSPRCLLHAFSSIAPLPPPLSCPPPLPPPPLLSGSPLSFLFFALSDMSRDSSDEESEEEEDFTQVQFGSRYTTGVCVFVCVCAHASLPFSLRCWLTTNGGLLQCWRLAEESRLSVTHTTLLMRPWFDHPGFYRVPTPSVVWMQH